ncbi:juvenile hormone esterase-like [Planococcus citri]|uniref:juvenile hormone esterase-like n=1 Tax=Planococcus citri TaxID=170843 RepID=UPI0031F771C7
MTALSIKYWKDTVTMHYLVKNTAAKCNADINENYTIMFEFKSIENILLSLVLISPVFSHVYLNTSLGLVKGTVMLSRNGNPFYAFLGLPYAHPPVGDLRFTNPIPYTIPWHDEYDATKQASFCIHSRLNFVIEGSEDCLYLNVYTPQLPSKNTTKLPVWFYIHPGRRLFGDPSTQRWGPHYIMDEPVIFVTAAYRLNSFGFLSMEDDVIPGNFGLKDQAAALLWIQRYISDYGGDPDRVTISGESSGGVDVSLHLSSPLSQPLFHRAIMQSGSHLNYRTVVKSGGSRRQAWKLASVVGCNKPYIKTSEDLLNCLRTIPAPLLTISIFFMMHDYILPHTYFGIVIENSNSEGAFLTLHPILEMQNPSNKTIMMGTNTNEGHQKAIAIFSPPYPGKKLKLKIRDHFLDDYQRLFPILFGFDHLPNRIVVMEEIKLKYFSEKPLKKSYHGIATAFGICTVQLNMIESALQYKGPKYFYHYDHLNIISYKKMYDVQYNLHTNESMGVVHGEEFRSIFHQEIMFPPVLDGEDRIVSERVVKLWSNFVAYGNPNGLSGEQIWKPVTTSDLEYLHISTSHLTMKTRPFWDEYIFFKRLGNPPLMNLTIYETLFSQNEIHSES